MKTVHSRLRGAGRRRTGRWSTLLITLVAVAAAQAPPSRQLQQIEAWLRQHPQDAVAWERAAAVQLELKQPDAAAASLEHVLALRPADTRVQLTLLQLLTSNPRCLHPAESAPGQQTAADVAPCGARVRRLWQGLPQAAQNDAAVEVLKVRVLLAEGEPSQAATFVSQLAAQHATDAKMQFTLGATLLQAGEAAAALPRLQAARRLLGTKHSDEALTFDLALAHFHLGDARAEPEFRQLHQRHPDDWEPAFYLAEIERRQGNWGSATALLVAAQQKHPQQPELALALATLATRQAFWVDAMDEWKTYRRLRPDDLDALEQLAIVAQMGRRTRLAEHCMQQYLTARPGDAHAHFLLALIEKEQGNGAATRRELETVLRLDPQQDHAWSTLGQLDLSAGHLADADRDFRKALHLSSVNADALTGAAQWQSRQGHPDKAVQLLQQAVHQKPQNMAAWYQLSVIARRAGQKSLALQATKEFRRMQANRLTSGGSGLLAYFKADVGLSPGQRRAHYIDFLQKALTTRPGDPRILSRLGIARLQDGDTRQALSIFDRIAGQPMPAEDARRAGEALLAAHQPQLALRFFQEAASAPGESGEVGLAVEQARAWLQQNQANRALQVLAQVPATAQPGGVAADMAALIYAAAGDDAHAVAAFRVALQTGAGQPAIARDAATFLGSRGHWPEALAVIRSARQQRPDSPELALDEAIFLQLAGHSAEAQQKLQALAFDPADPGLTPAQRKAAVLLGISYYTSDQRTKAASLFRRLTESAPELALPWYYRALLAAEDNHAPEALTWVHRSLQIDPDSAEAWYLEGKLLEAGHHSAGARTALQTAIQHAPAWAAPHFLLARLLRTQGDSAAAASELKAFHALSRADSRGEGRQLQSYLQGQLRAMDDR